MNRNSNQVSEANASRYVSATILKPFGIGIPMLTDMVRKAKYEILDSVLNYRNQVNSLKSYFDNQSIIVSSQIIAVQRGAIDPECTHVVDTEDSRIFQIEFGIKGKERRTIFGFNIHHR